MKGFFFICLYINKICKYVSFAKKRMRKEGGNESKGDQTVQDSPADECSSQSI